ncbi:hypothetical protein CFC21_007290 [Triticum aestivum]|uniref:Uncharacterized protein n=2 Tax=Triticum aestivum TaxID=4565 RepID=A0A9R1DDV5_WHEAT|nr:uncharacterized protein LOC119319200 isoform X2 [Triticum dicoccoides]XP_044364231.1 uncharacterized protein LOC123086535 [Triticum aestivum]KAF6990038.1 hypothetical protein CFC21_007290 [Triticum aestivum]
MWSTPILLRDQRPRSPRLARSFPAADGPPAPWPARSLLAAACPSSMDGLHRLPELVEVVPFILDLQLQVTNDATKRKLSVLLLELVSVQESASGTPSSLTPAEALTKLALQCMTNDRAAPNMSSVAAKVYNLFLEV